MLYEITVPQFIKMLKNLSGCLDKGASYAASKNFPVEVLFESRLAPDQFPLMRQVQIACDQAKLGAHRLTGKVAPAFEDNEKTLAEAKARIDKTIAWLETVTEADFAGAETKEIAHARWGGRVMVGRDYTVHHLIPNVYFHITTAYSILRHNGVDLGKADYLGAMPFRDPAASHVAAN